MKIHTIQRFLLPKKLGQGYFQGPSRTWDPFMVSFPYYSHIFRDSYGSGMGIVWETYHKDWGSLKIQLIWKGMWMQNSRYINPITTRVTSRDYWRDYFLMKTTWGGILTGHNRIATELIHNCQLEGPLATVTCILKHQQNFQWFLPSPDAMFVSKRRQKSESKVERTHFFNATK